jgi:hypothetical protein
MNILQQVARRLARLEALDKVAEPLAGPGPPSCPHSRSPLGERRAASRT